MVRYRKILAAAVAPAVLLALMVADMTAGTAEIATEDIISVLAGRDVPWQTRQIVLEIRTVRTISALLSGMAVGVCGLVMQTLFRNPLAGPHVLGINAGASLGAALFVLGTPFLSGGMALTADIGLAGAAWAGAATAMMIVAFASSRLRDIMTVLILGIMFSTGVDAIVQTLQFLGDNASLKSYVLWTMGSLGSVSSSQLPLLAAGVCTGLLLAVLCVKSLDLLLLGEEYAVTMGLDVRRTRHLIYLSAILLSGTVTAFCGPIGFLGLAAPHIARMLAGTSMHRRLLPWTAFTGAVLMLVCDIISRLWTLPVNAVASLLGIPVVIWIVLKYRK